MARAQPAKTQPATRKQIRANEVNKRNQARRQKSQGPRFPNTPQSHALSFPASKPDQIQENLKRNSPWYQSIIDPLHGGDAKIPDDVGDETGTLQLVQRTAVTVPPVAAACSGMRTNTLYSCQTGLASQGYVDTTGASTDTVIAWNANGIAYDTSPSLQSFAQGHRVVSAEMIVQPECSLVDCAGEMVFFVSPMNIRNFLTYEEYANEYGSTLVALNSLQPISVRWFPYSFQDTTFNAFYNPKAPAVAGANPNAVPFWSLGFLTKGVPAGVTFRVTIVINYEFLPLQNAINILDAAPSPSDATEMDLVENWVSEEPVAHPVSQETIMTPPSAVEPSQDGADGVDGFGMFLDVLTELVPIALEGIEFASLLI